MLSNDPVRFAQDLVWLLSGLIERVPDTQSALLLSSDGLRKAAHGLDDDGADHLAAIASGLFSLARSAGTRASLAPSRAARPTAVPALSTARVRTRPCAVSSSTSVCI